MMQLPPQIGALVTNPSAALPLLKNAFVSGGLMLMAVGAVLTWARNLPRVIGAFFMRRFSVTVDVVSPDPAFRWMTVWLDQQPYSKRARALSATAKRGPDESPDRILLTPAPGDHWFLYHWRPVWLSRRRDKEPVASGGYDIGSLLGMPRETITIRVLGRSQDEVRGILEEARVAASKLEEEEPGVFSGEAGYWRHKGTIRRRPMASVVLPTGHGERVLADLRHFRDRRRWYEDRAIPWRRGYLFHGVPGTGKTSLVTSLAWELRLSIYSLNVAACSGDASLAELAGNVPDNSILLLEDVDAALKNRAEPERSKPRAPRGTPRATKDRATGVTLSGLLNAIDGVATREGQVTVLTTNYLAELDSALVRPGRADVWLEFGFATAEQASRMYGLFYPKVPMESARKFGDYLGSRSITTAEIQQHLLQHETDAAAALALVHDVGAERLQRDG